MALPSVCMRRDFGSLVRLVTAMMDIGPLRGRRWCVYSLPKPRLHLGWVDHQQLQATPHVTGLVAYFLGLEPEKKISPAEMKKKVQDMALKGVLTSMRAWLCSLVLES